MTVDAENAVPSSSEVNGLADRLILEMRRAWALGDRPVTEDYLAAYPVLADHPGAAAELIYEEVSLRRARGVFGGSSEVLRRFPQWAAQLRVFLQLRDALDAEIEPDFPEIGERIGDFELIAELGRGRRGRVFLARQPALASRLMVVKLTPRIDAEHESLARLQHTHIVPLYSASDDPARRLRLLCMPYFGGVTLAHALQALAPIAPAERTTNALWSAIHSQGTRWIDKQPQPPRWAALDHSQLIAHFGACMADALQFAHDRKLVHMDVKPSNILLTADGEPMLLDFHLARSPLASGDPTPEWLGGSPAYSSPEQRAAVESVRFGQAISQAVDGRSDVYSLGVVLYEALAGTLPIDHAAPVTRRNRKVSRGLSDIIDRCLAVDQRQRYPNAAALALDLRRHLADLPLRGIRNRSLKERWRKWRRRRPHAVVLAGALTLVLAAAGLAAGYLEHRRGLAHTALDEGESEMTLGHFVEARGAFRRGLALAEGLPMQQRLISDLNRGLRTADRALLVGELHTVAEGLRTLSVTEVVPGSDLPRIEALGQRFWERRSELFALAAADAPAGTRVQARADLLDLVLIWSRLHVQLAPAGRIAGERQSAIEALNEAERELGPCPGLYFERAALARELGLREQAEADVRRAESTLPDSAWDHVVLGVYYLRRGEPEKARAQFATAVARDPKSFWARLHLGKCDLLAGRADDAVISFAVCVGIDPINPTSHLHKAIAHARLGQRGPALADIERAVQLDPENTQARTLRDEVSRLP